MAASRRRTRPGGHDNEDRWLLTYADMITLLMALFMILFAISSVNISKYKTLQQSLKSAFSGSILSGGRSILQTGAASTTGRAAPSTPVPAIVPLTPTSPHPQSVSSAALQAAVRSAVAAATEQSDFAGLQRRLESYASSHGFGQQVAVIIERRGLVVRVLTDKVLFDSGSASLNTPGLPLLDEIASLLQLDRRHPIVVEGHTDNVPIASSQFPTNWELSTARATTVVRYLISRGVPRARLAAAGYADLHPLASNATDTGRALNRRVEIVFQRLNPYSSQQP